MAIPAVAPDSGQNAWLLASSALVMLMLPALAMFYGGLVSPSAVLHTHALSFSALCLISISWSLFGYEMAFAADPSNPADPFIGAPAPFDSSDKVRLALEVPEHGFFVFQLLFAGVTAAVISGAVVERIALWAWCVFALSWNLLVYVPLARWIFYDNGFLAGWGVLDFAGGFVVEVSSGVSGFVLAWWLGRGQLQGGGGPPEGPGQRAHSVPSVLGGLGLLWVGWLGFNSGSAIAQGGGDTASYQAARAFASTHLSACAALAAWACCEVLWGGHAATWRNNLMRGRPSTLGAATGALVGLVAITPGCGFVSQLSALAIGAMAAVIVYWVRRYLMEASRVDDRLECLPVHGCAGAVGCLLTGCFARVSEGSPVNGLLYGSPAQLGKQAVALCITVALSAVGTSAAFGVCVLLGKLAGWPVALSQEQQAAVDLFEHGESAYGFQQGSGDGDRQTHSSSWGAPPIGQLPWRSTRSLKPPPRSPSSSSPTGASSPPRDSARRAGSGGEPAAAPAPRRRLSASESGGDRGPGRLPAASSSRLLQAPREPAQVPLLREGQ